MKNTLAALFLAIGLIVSGYFIAGGIKGWASSNRTINVKGVSERLVEADQAFWPVKFSVNGSDLQSAQNRLLQQKELIIKFLNKYNIKGESIVPDALEVNDAKLNPYDNDLSRAGDKRIIISHTLLVSSYDPKSIQIASRNITELVAQGVSISVGQEYMSSPTYVFTKLNDHKPEMLTLAIRSAKEAAERFSEESNTELGGIKSGSQGIFSIQPRYQFEGAVESKQIEKVLRVVSSVNYYIK